MEIQTPPPQEPGAVPVPQIPQPQQPASNKKFVIAGLLLLVAGLIIGGVLISGESKPATRDFAPTLPRAEEDAVIPTKPAPTAPTYQFTNPKKSPHYESNTPAHGAILPAPPASVVIDFNFDLAPGSKISIQKDGTEYGLGQTTIDTNKLAMRRSMSQGAADGLYSVFYTACWPDGSCHDGNFQFALNRSLVSNAIDYRGGQKPAVYMAKSSFTPQTIRVPAGATVTWTNNDAYIHYVNTDAHPSHTYEPGMNSKALALGETYSFTFTKPGVYPYHCSSHADTMTGMVVVD